MNYLSNRRLTVLLSLGLMAVLFTGYFDLGKNESGAEASGSHSDGVIRMEVSYGFEAKDEEKLVGFAENVFTGRVIKQVGSEKMKDSASVPGDFEIPQTQFSVEPLDNIKGDLTETITVNQQGGSVKQNSEKKKVLIEGDPLLEPGKKYMFVTRHEEDKDWYTIAAQPYGDVKVEDKVKRENVKEKFKQAKKEQKNPSKEFSKK